MNAKLLFFTLFILAHHKTGDAGFIHGAPCNPRNTAFLSMAKSYYPINPLKCVDITAMTPRDTANWSMRHLARLQSADTLYADHMHLRNVSRALLKTMPRLELIDLTGNQIRRLPATLGRMEPRLTKLLLAKNRVAVPLRRALIASTTLDTLMLSNNKIRSLRPVTFSKVPMLRVLYLDNNYLKIVTNHMFKSLTNLEYLHLGNNLLTAVPAAVTMPKSLIKYIVKGNKLN